MMPWSLEPEVLAWLCSNIQIEIPHNRLNGRHVEISNPGFFDNFIPMELPHTLYEWLKYTFLHLKVYSKPWKLCTISSVSQSQGWLHVLLFFIKNSQISHFGQLPWPWNHHPSMQTIIHVFFWFPPILLQFFICSSFHIWNVNSTPPTSSITIPILFYVFSLIVLLFFI